MFFRRHNELIREITELKRLVRQQGDAHAALMNQAAATQDLIRKEAQGIHERISFSRTPRS